ncbi:acyl-CoA dehydrogenase family protein [Pedobacter mucosus]|uniref:acyl-CoA dehydrogenase family protein n=1 Tax=Pedobacter mucosus TaxID=2895286 RepID=UPI001EE4841D|nr:acyl-CoA dehydrogenase family protein [Pedobacter mucosus]UKT64781.1 acyl-CoA/acyl-ACP dehydrogenase [Pedobacter mucosus]
MTEATIAQPKNITEKIALALKKISANATLSDDPQVAAEQEINWLREAGALEMVLPNGDLDFCEENTPQLLQHLKDVGKANLSIGRIYEGHINALYLIHLYASEIQKEKWYNEVRKGCLFGIWNTQANNGIQVISNLDSMEIMGAKTFCSGAAMVKYALITGNIEPVDRHGWQMMIIDMDQVPAEKIDRESWKPLGMKASGSYTVDFTGYQLKNQELLANPGQYLMQPYFNGGAIRFAAVQMGGAEAIAEQTLNYLKELGRTEDPFQKIRLANIFAQIETGNLWLEKAGKNYDAWVKNPAMAESLIAYANLTRVVIEEICLSIIPESNRCVGARGLMHPYELERLHRDLTFYLRQPAPDATRIKIAEYFINK